MPSTGLVCPGAAWLPNHSGIQEPSACCDAAEIAQSAADGAAARRATRRRTCAAQRIARRAWAVRSGELRVEGQLSPAAAEGRPAAVAVLQLQAATDAGGHPLVAAQRLQRKDRAGRVVHVGHAAGAMGPGPAAGRGVRVGMRAPCIAPRQSSGRSDPIDPRQFAGRSQRRHGGRGQPHRQVRVDRPGPFGSLRPAKKLKTLGRHRLRRGHTRAASPWPRNWSAAWLPGIRRARVESAAAFPAPAA